MGDFDTLKEWFDVTVNPRRVDEHQRMWDSFKDGTWFDKADVLTTDSSIRQVLYGAPFFSWLNYHSDLWRLIPKRPAPDKHGVRILQTGGATSGTATTGTYAEGMFETDTITSSTKASFVVFYYNMKWMDASIGISEKALYESGRDDAVDVWNANRTHMADQHLTNIDLYLSRNVNFTTRSTVVIDSLDRQISGSAEGTFLASGSGNSYSGATAAYIYPWGDNLHRTASGAGYGNGEFDAVVDENAGTLRSFSLDLLDGVIRQVRLNGKDTSRNFVIITGEDTADLISSKLEGKQRFPDVGRVQVGINGVNRVSETAVGGGFDVPIYKGIPILTSKSVYRNRAGEGTANPASGYSRIYGIDLDSFYISVGLPTIFLETGREHWLLLNKLRKKALMVTAAELVGTRWNTSFKIRDLTA